MTPPISRVLVAPSPALTGTTLTVEEDDGAVFPPADPPFTALVWKENVTPVVGTNAEYVDVTKITADELKLVRGDVPIAIEKGMLVAATGLMPVYELNEPVTLTHLFPSHEPPYVLTLHAPSGEIGSYGSADGVNNDGAGLAFFAFEPQQAGIWRGRFESTGRAAPDLRLFVKHSAAL